MTTTGRRLRLGAVAVCAVLLLLGTWKGSDDDFPFGPFRMYATAGRANGRVTVAEFTGTLATGRRVALTAGDLGLRRAEIEGQLPRLEAHPALLGELAAGYNRRADGPTLVGLEVDVRSRRVSGGRVTDDEQVRTVAAWGRR